MLSNYDCYSCEISACQPALSRVSHQLRNEVLPLFYSCNLFLAEVSDHEDLATAKRWLQAIGDANVSSLRRLVLCGWTRVPFGHMVAKRWVRIILNLKEGTIEVEAKSTEDGQHPQVTKAISDMKASFREMAEARRGPRGPWFDVDSVGDLMDGFHGLCTAY